MLTIIIMHPRTQRLISPSPGVHCESTQMRLALPDVMPRPSVGLVEVQKQASINQQDILAKRALASNQSSRSPILFGSTRGTTPSCSIRIPSWV